MENLIDVDVGDLSDDDKLTLTKWGCLYAVLMDYGIKANHISGRVGDHIVEDFMELMCKFGYCEWKDDK